MPHALSQGVSPVARYVDEQLRSHCAHLRDSNVLGQGVQSELGEVWENCRKPGWDGFGALAVSRDTLCNAFRILESLPADFPPPTIGAEPDGALTLEWHRSPRRTLSVSVDEFGDLHYAALLGPNRQYGTESFNGELPHRIAALVGEVYTR